MTRETHYWVVVAARDHAHSGIEQGIVQANHGKEAPLQRMQPGDGLLVYAPKVAFGGKEPLQRFIAVGTITDEPVYQVKITDKFSPFRRRVMYEPVKEVPIQPFIDQLSFIRNKASWGYSFRFGCFAIPQADFELLRSAITTSFHD